jgi:transposase-like protein
MHDREEPRPHRRRGEAFWRRALLAQRQSGSSQKEFCRRNGLSCSTFQHWKRRLDNRDKRLQPAESSDRTPQSPDFVELTLRPAPPATVAEAGFELIFPSGIRLKLPPRVQGRALTEVLWALEVTDRC